MAIHDLFDWTNACIGAVGLVLTIFALLQATGAKKAAQQASKNIRQHNAEVDFNSLARIAKEPHGYVEDGRMSEARLRTTDLRSELATAVKNHGRFVANELSRLLTEGLNGGPETLSSTERIRLLRITGEILEALAGLSGQFRSQVDREVSNV